MICNNAILKPRYQPSRVMCPCVIAMVGVSFVTFCDKATVFIFCVISSSYILFSWQYNKDNSDIMI